MSRAKRKRVRRMRARRRRFLCAASLADAYAKGILADLNRPSGFLTVLMFAPPRPGSGEYRVAGGTE